MPTIKYCRADFWEILAVVDEDHVHTESLARQDAHRRHVEEIMRLKCSYAGDVLEGALTEGQHSHVNESCHIRMSHVT